MTKLFGVRVTRVVLLLLLAIFTAGAACEKPVVGTMGTTVTSGEVAFEVPGYELRYLELSEGDKTVSYSEPVLAVHIKLTNQADKPLTYAPSHRATQTTEAGTPLLYRDPGPQAELPPESKVLVGGVYLAKGHLPEQVTAPKTLHKGESLEDVFLFEVPQAKEDSLILSLPPSMSHGNLPALIRIPYTYKEPQGPAVFAQGEAVERGGANFTVESAEVAYIKTTHSSQGKGYSSAPWLKITYKIENAGEEPIRYNPEHDVEGGRGAAVYAGNTTVKRVKLPPNVKAEGRIDDPTTIEPGKSVTDFALFEAPEPEVSSLTFEYPAARFGATGLIRVAVPYEYSKPDLPEEMQKKKAED